MSSAEKQQRKAARKLPGKDQGLTFWQCFAKDRLYTKDMPGIRPYLYIIPFFLAYFVLDFSLRYTYRSAGIVGVSMDLRGSLPWAGRWSLWGWCSACRRCPAGSCGACRW